MILAPDDIQVNTYVSIHSVRAQLKGERSSNRRDQAAYVVIAEALPVPLGVPLRVLSVSLPFVLCAVVDPEGAESSPAIIDVRVHRLTPTTESFVDALRQFGAEHRSSTEPNVDESFDTGAESPRRHEEAS